MGDQKASGHSVQRASGPERAALYNARVDHGRAHIGAQTVMLHPNNPAHSVEEFFSHDGNPRRIDTIRPNTSRLGHRQKGRFYVGKTEQFIQGMPYISMTRTHLARRIYGLHANFLRYCAINKQIARIFDKNAFRYIFSS